MINRLPVALEQGGECTTSESISLFCIMLPQQAVDLLPLDIHVLHSLLAYWYQLHGPSAAAINLKPVDRAVSPITGGMSEEDRVWEAEVTVGGEKTEMVVWWHRNQLQFHPRELMQEK